VAEDHAALAAMIMRGNLTSRLMSSDNGPNSHAGKKKKGGDRPPFFDAN
jgi:hypothetical protein